MGPLDYYNENDPFAAQWLRNLIAKGLIPDGHVDERSIVCVTGSDLKGFEQCHFFAGIGGWPRALELAGWSGPCWTGSCPCQPFSAAGKRKGTEDTRHLWPELRRLIAECRPVTIFGEQVESKDGRKWLSGVRSDVEVLGYRLGATDLCAPSVASPHRRQRLYWLAESGQQRAGRGLLGPGESVGEAPQRSSNQLGRPGSAFRLVQSIEPGLEGHSRDGNGGNESGRIASITNGPVAEAGAVGGMAEPSESRRQEARQHERGSSSLSARSTEYGGIDNPISGLVQSDSTGRFARISSATAAGYGRSVESASRAGFWSDFDIVHCEDGKARRIEAGTFPLAHGVPGRVGKLRAYGNAIVPQVAAEFIASYMETL